MIWQLMKRDAAWRWLRWLAPASVAASLLWLSLPEVRDFIFLAFAYGYFSLTPAWASNSQMRDVYFQCALPIEVRKIYLSRVISMVTLLFLPILLAVALGGALSQPAFAWTLLDLGSLFTLAIIAIQSAAVQCKLKKPGIHAFNLFWLAGFGVCAIPALPAWIWKQGPLVSTLFASCCWLGAAAIFLITWRALPESFDFAPKTPSAPVIDTTAGRMKWLAHPRLLIFGHNLHPVLLPYYFTIGLFLASKWFGDARWFGVWLAISVAWVSLRIKVRSLSPFPIDLRQLLPAIVLPMFLSLSLGYAAGLRIPWLANTTERGIMVTANADTELTDVSADCKMFSVLPPLEYRIPAQPDHAPLIRAPWGETFQPGTNKFDGFDVYNPFASDCDNSERFLDWQFARATAAVYGRSIPRDKAARAYVVASPVAIPRARKELISIGLIAAFLMMFTVVTTLDDWHRLRRRGRTFRRVIILLVTLPCCLLLFGVDDICQWASWALPANAFGAVAIAIIPLALLYWALDALFRQQEFVDRPVRVRP